MAKLSGRSSILISVALMSAVAGSAAAAGCGGGDDASQFPGPGADGSSSSDAPAGPLDGLTTLAITPATATANLAAVADPADGGTGYQAQTTFVATGTFSDGSSRDVSALVAWSASDPSVTIAAGKATSTAPGMFTISASGNLATASATLTVSLTGNLFGSGFNSSDSAKLDATPTGTAAVLAYPIDGSLFPANLTPVTVQGQKTDPTQTLARVALDGGAFLKLNYYGVCETGPNETQGCYVTLPSALTALFVGASATSDISVTTRMAAADGSLLVETNTVHAAWANAPLTGGLYYWTTIQPDAGQQGNTAIFRYAFTGDAPKPELVYSDFGSPEDHLNDGSNCIGCHAISPDGTKMSLAIGGSFPGDYMLVDIATGTRTVVEASSFGTFSTYSPDSSHEIVMRNGVLTLRVADATLADAGAILPTATTEAKTDPFWSPSGKYFAFTSFSPGNYGAPAVSSSGAGVYALDGDLKFGGQIWIASSNGSTVPDSAKQLVAREVSPTDATQVVANNFYPAITDDDALVVYNRSLCSGTATVKYDGISSACAGYDDRPAKLMLTTPAGGAKIALDNANGVGDLDNSWPRWSPDHSTFRGKKLYWVAYSSRRPYGLQINTDQANTKPQLWFAAVAIDPTTPPTTDPSFTPVWLPGQNPDQDVPNGNHVPQWTAKAVAITPR